MERLAVLGLGQRLQELWAGSFFIRPSAGIEYYRLSEDSYQEKGGGSALDLTVDERESDELAVNALFITGFELGAMRPDEGYFRFELEAGRRQIVGGELGDTSARFEDGETFVLEPEKRQERLGRPPARHRRQFRLPPRGRNRRRRTRRQDWIISSGKPRPRLVTPEGRRPLNAPNLPAGGGQTYVQFQPIAGRFRQEARRVPVI